LHVIHKFGDPLVKLAPYIRQVLQFVLQAKQFPLDKYYPYVQVATHVFVDNRRYML
jgi:hypothetical protein